MTNYYPLPRSLLKLELPSTALLLYSILLDRATLSQKNGFTDPGGWVFVVTPSSIWRKAWVCAPQW